jgi:Tol biopolymer transport system component
VCIEYIIFHTFRDGDLEVYSLFDGAEGSPTARLYNLSKSPLSEDSRPSRSPNDAWVVYETNAHGNLELYYTDPVGSFQTRLTETNSNNINPVFAVDNQTVFFQSDRNGNWDLFSVNLATGEEVQLTSDGADDINPFTSPDLRWLAFQSNRDGSWGIYLLNTETGEEIQVTRESTDEIFPAWAPEPNGQQIAYLSNENGTWELYVINLDGSGKQLISAGDSTGNHSWSPEGLRIAYQSLRDGNLDVYTYDLRDDSEYRLTDYEGIDSAPTWNCGGALISFTTERDGNPNVFQIDWQGVGSPSNLTIHPATDKWSEWSPSKEPASRGR